MVQVEGFTDTHFISGDMIHEPVNSGELTGCVPAHDLDSDVIVS